jgi:subtilisin family serine protease
VIAGLDWIAEHHADGTPAVANLSLGGWASASVDTAVQGVIDDGVTVVVAAGNSNANACNYSPARAANAITVAAVDRADVRASFSNWGSCVDIFAPGVAITSASISSTTASVAYSGTSMASPHVAGAAALVLSGSPGMSPALVDFAIVEAATTDLVIDPAGSPNRLLYVTSVPVVPPAEVEVPEAPGGVTAMVMRKRVAQVMWSAPADGGSPITSYTVTAQRADGWVASYSTTSTNFRINLRRGTYTFTVAATNKIGTGPASATSNAITVR